MKFLIACSLLVVATIAEPPVDNQYLPPNQGSNFRTPSEYGALQGQTDAIFGARQSLASSYNPRSSRPTSQYLAPVQARIPSTNYGVPSTQTRTPSAEYLPSLQFSQVRTPSSQYGAPSAQVRTPSSQYGAPSAQVRTPSSQYGAPSAQVRTPSSQYGAPSAQVRTPSSQYGAPSAQVRTPSSQYGAPSAQVRTPSTKYGTPGQVRTPSSQYGAPSSRLGAPSSQYGAPSAEYGTPSEFSRAAQQAPSSEYSAPSQQYGAPDFGEGQQYSQGSQDLEQSRQYLPPGSGRSGNGYDEDSNNEPASYSFEYAVKDESSGNDFGHRESREGDRAEGLYYVVLPDGRKQTVEYEADQDGFKPRISYEDTGLGYDSNAQTYDGSQGPY